jgi:hypothetical protein
MPFFCNPNFAARRGGAPILPVSENDVIFAYKFVPITVAVNCKIEVAKNGIVFAYFIFKENEELSLRPLASSNYSYLLMYERSANATTTNTPWSTTPQADG